MSRKQLRTLVVAISGAIILAHYQNCSPVGIHSGSVSSNEVRIVEDWIESKVTFVEPALDLQADATRVALEGLCARRGVKVLLWQLDNGQAETQLAGKIECMSGGFSLVMSGMQEIECGVDHWLWVTTMDGEGSALRVRRRCPAVQAEPIEVAVGGHESCFMELVDDSQGMQCQKVCYLEGRVYYQNDEELASCGQAHASSDLDESAQAL
ncbi:MAG: hypothetical protein IT288_18040 [Bdellovibrionales bacterium]|nr:hypothetical protein [Bdellovibrionales bacterium]